MIGTYITGANKAHRNDEKRELHFGYKMHGTFNIKIHDNGFNIKKYTPCFIIANTGYHLVKLTKNDKTYYGYIIDWKLSNQSKNIIEVVSKTLLPVELMNGEITLEILEKWSNEQRDEWAKNMYSWQTFDWSPKKRANSKELSNVINKAIGSWAGLTVLDIGSNYGYHSFNASKKGAIVTGIEINDSAREKAEVINNHIEMQDVVFYKKDNNVSKHDVILFLSVHHQYDPSYKNLKETLDNYKKRCNKYFVVELITPPMFAKNMSVGQIDEIVNGEVLMNYKHPVRGIRRLYLVKK